MSNELQTIYELSKMKASDIIANINTDVKQAKDVYLFAQSLDKMPHPSWVKTNKYSGNAKYLPIRIVEQLLRTYFGAYQVEMIGNPSIIGNSIVVSVHLKVYHPVLKEWLIYAGVGAVPIELEKPKFDDNGVQTSGAKSPLDFDSINAKALHKNVPAAKSYAISNAAKTIGKIFGSHLNSAEDLQISDLYSKASEENAD